MFVAKRLIRLSFSFPLRMRWANLAGSGEMLKGANREKSAQLHRQASAQ
jgi:hypothetical protein